ncbi:PqqD family peptide modification chaperone [Nocardioides okcheonensis]|uniref:PqqD family peptide modification chaperone n=1 Tax=Nocardioides okcheonensis TaxID=2894081 RepID=UPI001E60E35C|nr:PqqD family peptide modification chaperone [Nocardioides okcheonensis]UFN46578.1 PqqD family peptide modification chaperone [Nocardioides okcheonensis]
MTHQYRIADDVAWVSLEDLDVDNVPTAYLTRVPKGLPIMLEGSACLVWLALAEGGTLAEVTAAAAAMSDADADAISDDVSALVDQLVAIRVVDEE